MGNERTKSSPIEGQDEMSKAMSSVWVPPAGQDTWTRWDDLIPSAEKPVEITEGMIDAAYNELTTMLFETNGPPIISRESMARILKAAVSTMKP
jgi:hypothetical protein